MLARGHDEDHRRRLAPPGEPGLEHEQRRAREAAQARAEHRERAAEADDHGVRLVGPGSQHGPVVAQLLDDRDDLLEAAAGLLGQRAEQPAARVLEVADQSRVAARALRGGGFEPGDDVAQLGGADGVAGAGAG